MSADRGMAGMAMTTLAGARDRIAALGSDLAQAPVEMHGLSSAMSAALISGSGVRAFTYLLILLLIGVGVEWLYWTYAYTSLRAVESTPVSSPRHAFRLGLRRLALLGSGLVLFAFATLGASAAFSWPKGVHEAVLALTLLVLVLRLAWLAVAVVLAPASAALRLVPVAQGKVRWLAATLIGVAALLAFGRFVPDLAEQIGGARHSAAACAWSRPH